LLSRNTAPAPTHAPRPCRLEEQFTDPDADEGLPERQRRARAAKPAEHKATFAGNTDDHFRLGIRLTRGSVKLFSDLYQSDIIVASPIALATKIAEDAKKGEGAGDFLSSVEVLVVDRADVLLMQNWAHVETVLEHLNNIPKQQHGTDIMRVSGMGGQCRGWRCLAPACFAVSLVTCTTLYNHNCHMQPTL
jgi:U3 small nucleolar RNA-associated protein 25